jgi:hypothetical protein
MSTNEQQQSVAVECTDNENQQSFPNIPFAGECCDNENQQQSFPNIPTIAVECDIENQRPSLPQLPIAENDIVNLTENDERAMFPMCCEAFCDYFVFWLASAFVSGQFLTGITTYWAFLICFIAWFVATTIGLFYKGFRLLFILPIIFWLFQ